jgi:capsular polysaccharide biosynthesis protein
MDPIRRPIGYGAGHPSGGQMSQQALDLRKSIQLVRQHKILLGIVVAMGILGGAAYGVLKPPMFTSTVLIALPTSDSQQAAASAASGTVSTDPLTQTQEIVAGSAPVLKGALPHVHPSMSVIELHRYIQVGSPSPDIISLTAEGRDAATAEDRANAVAESYIRYLLSKRSAVGRIQARLLASASSATQSSPAERTIVYALLGALGGAVIGVIVVLAIGRNDRRLRLRDDIANSIGIPVLASIPVAHPSGAAAWTKLFEDYKPAARQTWQLMTALEQLGMATLGGGRTAYRHNGRRVYDDRPSGHDGEGGAFSLTVLSLSSDAGAVALGPQLAAFTAAQGIPTSLVIGPQQDEAVTASLRVACAAGLSPASNRSGPLRLISYEDGRTYPHQPGTAVVIVVAVVDSRAPEMPDTMRTGATVIGVSAGAATAEQLARAVVVAAAAGWETTGILVADPLDSDNTTGRIPRLVRPAQPKTPNRLRGVVTENRR